MNQRPQELHLKRPLPGEKSGSGGTRGACLASRLSRAPISCLASGGCSGRMPAGEAMRLRNRTSGQRRGCRLCGQPRVKRLALEEGVHELHRDCALSNRRGDTLDRSVSHVSGCQHGRHAGLEQ